MFVTLRRAPRWHKRFRIHLLLTAHLHYSKRSAAKDPHVHSEQHLPKSTEKPAITTRISNLVLEFIKTEGRNLIQNLEERDSSTIELSTESRLLDLLSPAIRKDVESELDDYNKLQALLSYHPILVRPDLYMHYLNKVQVPLEDNVRTLTLKRLCFHRMYEECWSNEIISLSSLDDIEDFVAMSLHDMEEKNDLYYGIVELLASSKATCSPNIFAMTNDLIERRMTRKSEIVFTDHLNQCIKTYTRAKELAALVLIMGSEPNRHMKFFQKVGLDPTLSRVPGWSRFFVSSLTFKLPTEKGAIDMANPTSFNIVDVVFFFNTVVDTSQLYHLIKRSLHSVGRIAKQHILQELCSRMVRANDSSIEEILTEQWNVLPHDTFNSTVLHILLRRDSARVCEMVLLQKQRELDVHSFRNLIDCLVKDHFKTSIITQHSALFRLATTTSNRALSRSVLESIFKRSRSDDKATADMFNAISANERYYEHKLLIELGRSALLLRENIKQFDLEAYIVKVITSFLSNLRKGSLENQKNPLSNIPHKDRALFHNQVRETGQFFALLSEQQCAYIMNITNDTLKCKEHFPGLTRLFGAYILRILTYETLRFITRDEKTSTASRVSSLLRMEKLLHFDTSTVRGFAYHLEVRNNPWYSFTIIRDNRGCKSKLNNSIMSMILTGILKSPVLDDKDKLRLFKEFREELRILGYKNALLKTVMIDLVELIIQCADRDDFSHNLAWVLPYAAQERIPYKKRKIWKEQIRVLRKKNTN